MLAAWKQNVFTFWFVVFALTSWIFEPYVVWRFDFYKFAPLQSWSLQSHWIKSFAVPQSGAYELVGSLWRWYNQFDPLFFDTPDWLRLMCAFDMVGFGAAYVAMLYGFSKRAEWLRPLAIVYSSAIIYSCIIYFLYEFAFAPAGTNLVVVVLVNAPYLIVPLWLLVEALTCSSFFGIKKRA
jgi:EXPERA (EXPanded EBP superfamily)